MKTDKKIALITGGSRGLGRSAALALAADGIDVVITYQRQREKAAEVVNELQALGAKAAALELDVADVGSFSTFAAKLHALLQEQWQCDTFNFLINNAGFGIHAPFEQTSEEQFDSLLNVHFKGVFFLTQQLLPRIADGGRIINFSTGLTRFCLPGYGAYAAMKGAMEVLSRYLAKELGVRGIRVNTVAPGAIDTDFNKAALSAHPEMRGFIGSQTALGRMGEATDIGGVIALLCADGSGWINAQRVEASGGMFI